MNINSNGLLTGTSIGTWTFETFDAFNEGGTTIDNIWSNLSINIQDALPPDTNQNVNLGALVNDDSTLKVNGDFTSNGIHDFYTFTISESVDADALSWLNIRTTGMDTELGLYDSLGNFIATDDDGNGGYPPGHSMLSFGGANDPHINTPTTSGEDGVLAAGTYTVVVGGYNTVFGATLNDITGGTAQGNYSLSINYAPEPATLTLLAFGAIGLIRRRR
ncbi:MAG: PEP-CTERM sorting domain-containing protein [Planctomycetes bacterium]|nr:PEP-CTERM sorting domain-containing protein [Planctomycetota bacterium]